MLTISGGPWRLDAALTVVGARSSGADSFAADWWCIGILTFECFTTETPFIDEEPMNIYRNVLKVRVQSSRPSNPLPAALTRGEPVHIRAY